MRAAVASGGRPFVNDPRGGTSFPVTTIATMITTNGNASFNPCWGNQDGRSDWYRVISDWEMPMRTPVAAVMPNDENRPMSAAASAGMISSVNVVAFRDVIGAIRIPATAASMHAMNQFVAPMA